MAKNKLSARQELILQFYRGTQDYLYLDKIKKISYYKLARFARLKRSEKFNIIFSEWHFHAEHDKGVGFHGIHRVNNISYE